MQIMRSTKLFFAVGTALTFGWLFLYAESTVKLINAVLNNEPYYLDVTPFYLLAYALAPFSAHSYIDCIKQTSAKPFLLIKQWFNFVILTLFALMQLILSIGFFFVFFETFTEFEPILEWFLIVLPITFLAFFMLIVYFLFKTRKSLNPSLAN
jgi:hypothetical protein